MRLRLFIVMHFPGQFFFPGAEIVYRIPPAAAMLSLSVAGTTPEPYWLEYTWVNSAPQKNIKAE